ncbi:MAG: transketolase [Coriobacteriia bacterium]|nr:transketolase [Coriobacteriia bacterium]
MFHLGFDAPMTPELAEELRYRARQLRGASLTATTTAASGHPGGSMSSAEIYTVLFSCARLRPAEPRWHARDRVVISHGHTSPGAYAALALAGFFPLPDFVAHFRQTGSPYEGHVERAVPGIEWSSGNLGQGLSAGVGMALGARMTGLGWHTYVVMSDGEQHKGQVAEARRLAAKEGLGDLTAIVDFNGIQISGHTRDVMPVNVVGDFAADGWRVIEVNGHDVEALHAAISDATFDDVGPVAVVAHTIIGKGVSFMEDDAEYHGRGLTAEEYVRAMAELSLEPRLDDAKDRRSEPILLEALPHQTPAVAVNSGEARTYGADDKTDNRSAWGNALADLASANPRLPVAVLDCDLAVSVKTEGFAKARPDGFVQCGVGEHNACTVGGALSTCGVLTFWSDFGVFGCDETYNQQRLNDINGAALKLALTHCGVDVGEDGKTHQCLDYVGAFRELFGWKVIVPADPNQTDRAVRAAAVMQGCVAIAMGRSKLDVVTGRDGVPAFGGDYSFEYGRIDWVREGSSAAILAMGTPVGAAVAAADALEESGFDVAVGVVACPLDLDDSAMKKAARRPVLFTVEDHSIRTGLAASVGEWLALNGVATRLERIGVPGYQSSGAARDLLAACDLDADGIVQRVMSAIG